MADYITRIRTIDGDKQIDYNALANLPDLDKPIDYNTLENLPDLDQKSNINHKHIASEVGALSVDGGSINGALTVKDTLTVKGIVLTEGIDYGSGDPGVGVLGQLYFKRVT